MSDANVQATKQGGPVKDFGSDKSMGSLMWDMAKSDEETGSEEKVKSDEKG